MLIVIAVGLSSAGHGRLPGGARRLVRLGRRWVVACSHAGDGVTFFAFIGFEDTLNVAEECKEPERTIPIGLLTAMGIAAILYVAVAITAVVA